MTAARMSGRQVGRSRAGHRSPSLYDLPCGRSRSLPTPPFTVALMAASTAVIAGSACLCCSIAARKARSSRSRVTPRSGQGVDVGGLQPVVPRVQVGAALAAQVPLEGLDVVAELL